MSKPRTKKRYTLEIDPDIHHRLKRAAAHFGNGVAEHADLKLGIGLTEDEKAMRKEFNKAASTTKAV